MHTKLSFLVVVSSIVLCSDANAGEWQSTPAKGSTCHWEGGIERLTCESSIHYFNKKTEEHYLCNGKFINSGKSSGAVICLTLPKTGISNADHIQIISPISPLSRKQEDVGSNEYYRAFAVTYLAVNTDNKDVKMCLYILYTDKIEQGCSTSTVWK